MERIPSICPMSAKPYVRHGTFQVYKHVNESHYRQGSEMVHNVEFRALSVTAHTEIEKDFRDWQTSLRQMTLPNDDEDQVTGVFLTNCLFLQN
jgi:hypothetical protein